MFALGRKPILVSRVYAAQKISKEEGCFAEAALFLLYISPEKSKLRRNPTPCRVSQLLKNGPLISKGFFTNCETADGDVLIITEKTRKRPTSTPLRHNRCPLVFR